MNVNILFSVYAPTRRKERWKLPNGLSWKTIELTVRRLQMRIAKAATYDPDWTEYFRKRSTIRKSKNQDSRFVEESGWLHEDSCLKSA